MRCALLCALLVLLAACGDTPRAPVEDRGQRPRAPGSDAAARQYHVQRGDTLYSIAFRYGLDFRRMAAANGIAKPYTIYPGQRLVLREAAVPVARPPTAKPASQPQPAKTPPATKPKPAPVTPSSSAGTTTSKPPAAKPRPTPNPTGKGTPKWRWPAAGKVSRGYSATVHKGIDIAGKRGDAIYAVADGKVVYAGTGIVGFGELLIIKHNDIYLSAYGHNDRLLVSEGQWVKAGQKIATKGSSGTDTVKLHFEIRKEGKPVNPLGLLPRR